MQIRSIFHCPVVPIVSVFHPNDLAMVRLRPGWWVMSGSGYGLYLLLLYAVIGGASVLIFAARLQSHCRYDWDSLMLIPIRIPAAALNHVIQLKGTGVLGRRLSMNRIQ